MDGSMSAQTSIVGRDIVSNIAAYDPAELRVTPARRIGRRRFTKVECTI
jgi:hypothetical protein